MSRLNSFVGVGSFVLAVLMLGGLENSHSTGTWWQWAITITSLLVFGYVVYRYITDEKEEKEEQRRDDLRRHVNNLRKRDG